jgi:uncharacterized phage protein (TIGR02220 family)
MKRRASVKTWFPFYVADYLADTRVLSTEEHGAYVLLLCEYWINGAPANDDVRLAKVVGTTVANWRQIKRILVPEFFTIEGGRLINARAEEERAIARDVFEARVESGKKASAARWGSKEVERVRESSLTRAKSLTENETGDPSRMRDAYATDAGRIRDGCESDRPSQPQLQNPGKDAIASCPAAWPDLSLELDEIRPPTTRRQEIRIEFDQAREVLAFLNERAGKAFQPVTSNLSPIVSRIREGATLEQLRQVVALKVRAWKNDDEFRKFLRPETLFRKSKFWNYAGELVPVEEVAS